MKKTFYLLFLFFLIPFFGEARYYGSQITYKYAKPENRLYITVKYWRYCDDTIDPLVANILVEMPGCDNFTVPIAKTTITDVSIHKNLHPNAICVLPNAKNAGRGLEEFVSTASFALDTAPFASAAANGCCNVYLTAQIGSLRPSEITTGQRLDFHTNFALINICNLLGMDTEELSSPGFLMPMFTDRITCNNTATIDFGAYSMSSADSLSFEMAAPLGVSRTNVLGHFAPLSVSSPMTTYCPNGFSRPCIPIANASPAIGFSVNHKTGALTFHPIDCNEKGVVVLQAVQWIKDTNRVWKLAGMVRRDFTILVNGAVNNQPELLGPYDFQVIKGDTLNFKVFTKDAPVVVPPPGLSKMDTTYLIVKNSSTRIKYSIIDATKRERELAVSYVADSADVSKTLVCAVLAHDNDSLPLRTMRAYRIKVLEKLIVSTQLTPKSCGIMELDLLMDSLNYSNFKSGSPVLRLEGQGFNKTFNLDSGINRIQLPAPGLFSYKLEVYGKNYGFSQADTFSYNQEMVRIDKQKRNFSFCYSSPSKPILPLVYANQNRILQYQWLKSGVLQTNDNFYIVTAAERINFKVNSANCADSLDFNIDSFNYPFRKRHEITVFEPYCDTLKLRQFFGTYFFSDSLLVAMQGIADPNLLETNMAYFTCAAFPASNNVNRTILLQQRNREEGCLIADTIHLILLNKPFMFSDDSFCNQLKEMDLANFSNKANEANESKIKFTLKREGVDISNKLSIDSSLGAIHFYNLSLLEQLSGKYSANIQYQFGQFKVLDSFNFNIKNNPKIALNFTEKELCLNNGSFDVLDFLKNPSGNETFKILKIGAKIFSDSQAKYLVANVFNTEHRSEVYSIGAQKTADNGCVQDTLFTIKLNPLPVFSLGADINANGFTMLNIRAKSDEPNYFWNLPNIGNKDRIQGMASTFNFQAGSNPIICKVIDKNSCQWSDTLVIQFSTNLKTMDVLEARLFPNPASQKIVFEWDKTINPNGFKIFDLTGKSLPLHPWTAQGNQITLDLSNYPQGMYILQFQADEKIHFTQFSILRP